MSDQSLEQLEAFGYPPIIAENVRLILKREAALQARLDAAEAALKEIEGKGFAKGAGWTAVQCGNVARAYFDGLARSGDSDAE